MTEGEPLMHQLNIRLTEVFTCVMAILVALIRVQKVLKKGQTLLYNNIIVSKGKGKQVKFIQMENFAI